MEDASGTSFSRSGEGTTTTLRPKIELYGALPNDLEFRLLHLSGPIADHKQKPLLRQVASEKLVKRLYPPRAGPSKGISAVGRSRPVGDFPKAPFDLSSATKTDTKEGDQTDWGRRRGI